ncbi:MAG: HAMP domain-containing histidine kinase [Ignavibacteria bacterium]|jgi:signal transduction histidine kinase|nr:HAMP domain-containing histidine kinase [Ignavibacteria bacterium]MCU7504761.1 HAMP domain-containing histidine kinase [Ignavibacteria bacterium]MCU7516363.1 HAMP domain-containing histidine kinase [Ignavibacteria bacterium]
MNLSQARPGVNNNPTARERILENQLEELITNITTYIPHELRTPLVAIMGFTQIMTEELDSLSKEDLRHMAANIEKGGRRLYRTIEKFISFAEIECLSKDAKMKKELEEASVHAHSRMIKETVFPMAQREGRHEDLMLSIEDAGLQIPENYLRLIVKELFDNAMKFSVKGSKLELTGKKGAYRFQMSVKDYGIGIGGEAIDRIKPFRQFNRKTLQQGGNGLGLSIVKRITEVFDCSIEIMSQKDIFTAITIEFPYNK